MAEVTRSHFRAKPLGALSANPDWAVYKVLEDGYEQLVCKVPHWHDDVEHTAQTIAQSLESSPPQIQTKIGLTLK